jgi:GTP-binding protein Era
VNAVLRSLALAAGDELLTTDHAYGACRNTLDYVAGRAGATLVLAELPFPVAAEDDLVQLLPEGPLYFPLEQTTDLTLETRVAEVIREKALHLTRDEVPHAISVSVEEIGDKIVRAFLLVETESQKGILVGKKGVMVREIGSRARPEVERLVGHPVFLELVVRVRSKWRRDPKMIERLGM